MRHRVGGAKLGRTGAHRDAMLRNLVTSLLEHERVRTTHAKARAARPLAERMITLGKRGDLAARRRALRVIRSRDVAAKVFDELAERFRARPGGYTRITRLGRRPGDAAEMSLLELMDREAAAAGKGEAKGDARARVKAAKEAKAERKQAAKAARAERRAEKASGKAKPDRTRAVSKQTSPRARGASRAKKGE
jgi:large subunit ribosomal protein L17